MSAPAVSPPHHLFGRMLADGGHAEAGYRLQNGATGRLPLARWLGPVGAADRAVLAQARGPVIDIGCGPGRHLAALAHAGEAGLGLDLSPIAVRMARARGVEAIVRDVFAPVPGAGAWQTALLLDGNIGIGGAPVALLARVRTLVAPGGRVLVETDPPGVPLRRGRVRLEAHAAVSPWFGWATVGAEAIAAPAHAAGLRLRGTLAADGRWFVRLERPR